MSNPNKQDGGSTSGRMPVAALLIACAFTLAAGGFVSLVASAGATVQVSQKGRAFAPAVLTISKGDTVTIVNDDADLLHHAYVASDTFSFDSGDQAPGSKVDVVFSKAGTFNVLCGIHPKMKMVVHVN